VFTFKSIGCIAVSGGLSNLRSFVKLIDKGVTVEQVAKVTHNLPSGSYGTCLSYVWISYQIENDRQFRNGQLFEAGVLQSGFSINLQ
jgi:hypothetical protein